MGCHARSKHHDRRSPQHEHSDGVRVRNPDDARSVLTSGHIHRHYDSEVAHVARSVSRGTHNVVRGNTAHGGVADIHHDSVRNQP